MRKILAGFCPNSLCELLIILTLGEMVALSNDVIFKEIAK